jgi:BlaI family transcriptional regulator, penicillinase repressor
MPKRSVPLPGGALEYSVLVALWDLGRATTRQIHERVGEPGGLVYTTTAKVLDRLYAKGLVSREQAGRVLSHRPKIAREVVERARALHALGQILGLDATPAIAALVDTVESIDPRLLDELARAVAARRRSRHGS